MKEEIYKLGQNARQASYALANFSEGKKNKILKRIAEGILENSEKIIAENQKDISIAKKEGLSSATIDRLLLDEKRVAAIAGGVRQVAKLSDPVGEILKKWQRPNGMEITKIRVPIGVIGIFYESRPNVTSDAAVLCLKSGNVTILRGGKEARHSNKIIAQILQKYGEKAELPPNSIQLIPFTERESVKIMAQMEKYIDLIIPRGGHGLIETVVSLARMPVIKHYDGICHLYIHKNADEQMAINLTIDGKTQKPSVCNAIETLLIDEVIAEKILPKITKKLQNKGVELRGDEQSCQIIGQIKKANPKDWSTEYLDLIISIKIVKNIKEAIKHINKYGSHHSD